MLNDKIVVVDYGMGNLHSVVKSLSRLGGEVLSSSDADIILSASKLILPGVGHFAKAMENIQSLSLDAVLHQAVLENKIPVLGICLGMQLMSQYSEEGQQKGLGWFDANVVRFDFPSTDHLRIPHMGWNQLSFSDPHPMLIDVDLSDEFYFVHAYHWQCNNAAYTVANTNYGYPFASAVARSHIWGVQFHPEKSRMGGEKILRNFLFHRFEDVTE